MICLKQPKRVPRICGGALPVLLACAGLAVAATGRAADDFTGLSLEELGSIKVPMVVGASKHEQKITDAPSAVSIVTAEDIQHFGYRTLGDLLRSVRGFYVTSDRIYNYTGLRGVNRPGDFGGRVLINVDGHRLNEPLYDSAFTSTDFMLDLDLVDRVEVIRGPGSSLYGNNAFFTVINVVTRRGRDLQGAEAAGTAASFDTYTGRLSYGRQFDNGLELLVSGTYLDGAGHKRFHFAEFDAINRGVAENLDRTTTKSGFASLRYGDFEIEGGFIDRRKKNPTGQFGSEFNDPRALNVDQRSYAELKFAHTFEQEWSVQSRLYYDHYRYYTAFAFAYDAPAPGPLTVNSDLGRAQWVGGELLVTKTLGDQHRFTAGAEFRDDFQTDLANFDVAPRASYVDAKRTAFATAFFGQAETTLLSNLKLNAGVRWDHFSADCGSVNPRGALNYRPWRDGTIKVIYGQAFRAPNVYETDYIQPSFKTNPGLRPETIRSYEIGYEQGLPGHLRFSGTVFVNQVKGLIGQLTDPRDDLNYFDNLDAVEARGFEAELEGQWQHSLRARLSYTYTEARDTTTRRILDNSPRHLGKASVAVPLWRGKFFLSAEFQAMSRRTTAGGATIGAVGVANFTLFSRELVRHLEFSANRANAFDQKYRDPVSTDFAPLDTVPQDGRTLRVKLVRKF